MGMRHILPLLLVFGMVFSACVPLDYYDKAEVSSISIKLVGTNPDNSTNYNVSLFATINGHDVPVKDAVIFIQPFNTTGFRKEYLCRTITDGNGTATFSASKAMMNKTTFVAVFCYSNASLTCAIDDCLVVFDDNGNIGYKPSYPSPNGIGMTSYTQIPACSGASGNWGQTAKVFNLTGTGNWNPANLFLSSSMVLTRASGTRVLSTDQLSICLPISILVGLLIASMFYMGVNPFFWFSMDRTQRAYIKPDTRAIQSSLTSGLSQHETVLGSVVNKTTNVFGAVTSVSSGSAKSKEQTPKLQQSFAKSKGLMKAITGVALVAAKTSTILGKGMDKIGVGKVMDVLNAPAKWAGQGQAKMVASSQLKGDVMAQTGKNMQLAKAAGATQAQTKAIMAQGRTAAGQISAATKGMAGAIGKMVVGTMLYLVLRTYGLTSASISGYTKSYVNGETEKILKTLEDKKLTSTYVAAQTALIANYAKPIADGGLGLGKEAATAKAQKDVDAFVKNYDVLQGKIDKLSAEMDKKLLLTQTDSVIKELAGMQKELNGLRAQQDALCKNALGLSSNAFAGKASASAGQLAEVKQSMDITRSLGQELGNTISMKALLMYMDGDGDKGKVLLDSFNSIFIPGALTVDIVAQINQYFPPSEREQVAKSVEKIRVDFEKVSQKISVTKFDADANKSRSIQETVSKALDTALNSGDAKSSEKAMEQIRSVLGGSDAGRNLLTTIESDYKAKAELLGTLASKPELVNDACEKHILASLGQSAAPAQISQFNDSINLLRMGAAAESERVVAVVKQLGTEGYSCIYNQDNGTLVLSEGGKQFSKDKADNLLMKDFGMTSDISPAVAQSLVFDASGPKAYIRESAKGPAGATPFMGIAIDANASASSLHQAKQGIMSDIISSVRNREQEANVYDGVLASLNRLDVILQDKGMRITGFDKEGAAIISDKEGNQVKNVSMVRNQITGTGAEADFESAIKALAENKQQVKNLLGEGRGKDGSNPATDVRDALIVQVKGAVERREAGWDMVRSFEGDLPKAELKSHLELYAKISGVDAAGNFVKVSEKGSITVLDKNGNEAPEQQKLISKFGLGELGTEQKDILARIGTSEAVKNNNGVMVPVDIIASARAHANEESVARYALAEKMNAFAANKEYNIAVSSQGEIKVTDKAGKAMENKAEILRNFGLDAPSERESELLREVGKKGTDASKVAEALYPTVQAPEKPIAFVNRVKEWFADIVTTQAPTDREYAERMTHSMLSSSSLYQSMTKSVESDIFGTIVGTGSSGSHINEIYKNYADVEDVSTTKAGVYSAQRSYMDYMNSKEVRDPSLRWDDRSSPGLIPYLLGDFDRKKAEEPKPYERPQEPAKPPAREIAPLVEQPAEPEHRPVQVPHEPAVSYNIKSGDSIWEINRHAIETFYPKFNSEEMKEKDRTKILVAMENYMKKGHEMDFGLEKSEGGKPGYREMPARSSGEGGLYRETHGLEAGTTLSLRKSEYEKALSAALPESLRTKLDIVDTSKAAVASAEKPVEVTAQRKEGPETAAKGTTAQKRPETGENFAAAGEPGKPKKPKKPPTA